MTNIRAFAFRYRKVLAAAAVGAATIYTFAAPFVGGV